MDFGKLSFLFVIFFVLCLSVSLVAFDLDFYEEHSSDALEAGNVFSYFVFGEFDSTGYSAEELVHLKDVRVLLLVCLALALLCFGFIVYMFWKGLYAGLFYGGLGAIGLLLLCVVLGLFAFDWLFLAFHKIAFFNNYWLLPADSKLISTFPFEFFYLAFFRVLVYAFVFSGLFALIGKFKKN